MPVRYKYSNEEEQIVNGDNYEINFYRINVGNIFQAVGSIYYQQLQREILFISPPIRTDRATLNLISDKHWVISSNANPNDSNNIWFALPIIGRYEYYPRGQRSNPEPLATDIEQALSILPDADPPKSSTGLSQAYRLGGSRYFTQIVNDARAIGGAFGSFHNINTSSDPKIIYYHPCEYTSQYTLLIYSNEALIFNRTSERVPEYVEIFEGKECPNSTCPVKCDEYVCCYGSDGIATEGFLFSESIYQ